MKHLIVIDDTGSPGNTSESKTLKSDRFSFTAVLIFSTRRNILETKMKELLNELQKKHINIKEFHFTDIINRRKSFSNLTSDEVLNIFSSITKLLEKEKFYIFHQTITPRTLQENGLEFYFQFIDPSRRDIKHIALDFLCQRIKSSVKSLKIKNLFEVIIDEGMVKKGGKVYLPFLSEELKQNPYANSESSEASVLLQIADFYAFVINRMQMLMIKNKISDFDKSILEIIQQAFLNKTLSGIKGKLIDPDEISKKLYDEEILKKYNEHGNLHTWRKANERK